MAKKVTHPLLINRLSRMIVGSSAHWIHSRIGLLQAYQTKSVYTLYMKAFEFDERADGPGKEGLSLSGVAVRCCVAVDRTSPVFLCFMGRQYRGQRRIARVCDFLLCTRYHTAQ